LWLLTRHARFWAAWTFAMGDGMTTNTGVCDVPTCGLFVRPIHCCFGSDEHFSEVLEPVQRACYTDSWMMTDRG
jgi:hypothetical protein